MVEGRQRADWRRTAELISLHANINRDTKRRHRPYQWVDFYPFPVRNWERPKQPEMDMGEFLDTIRAKPGGARRDEPEHARDIGVLNNASRRG